MNAFYRLLFLIFLGISTLQSFGQQSYISVTSLPFYETLKNDMSIGVAVFIGPDCPISQKYVHTLKQIQKEFSQIRFYGIIPNNFSLDEVNTFKKEYEIPFEFYLKQLV